jgi:Flp pilus assembly protein TadD
VSVILDALKRSRQRGDGKSGPPEARALMSSFGFGAVASRRFDPRRVLRLAAPFAVVAVVLGLAGFWWLRSKGAGVPASAGAAAVSPEITQPVPEPTEPALPPAPEPASPPAPAVENTQAPPPVVPEPRRTRRAAPPVAGDLVAVPPPAIATEASGPVTVRPEQAAPVVPPPAVPPQRADSTAGDPRDPYDALLTFYAIGDYPRALEECRRAIELRPEGESTRLNCAAVHIQLGNLADAERELTVVTRLNEKNDKAFNNLGTVYMLRGEHAAADGAFERALAINPANASAHLNRGTIARTAGRIERAKTEFLAVIQLEPRNIRAHQYLASIFDDEGETARALNHYRRFRELAVGLPEFRSDVGRAETRIGELESRLPRP